jgi:hypothetical protein
MVLANSDFHMLKSFSEYLEFGHAPSKKCSPAVPYAEKVLKNIGLKGRQIISLPAAANSLPAGAPLCLGQALFKHMD